MNDDDVVSFKVYVMVRDRDGQCSYRRHKVDVPTRYERPELIARTAGEGRAALAGHKCVYGGTFARAA